MFMKSKKEVLFDLIIFDIDKFMWLLCLVFIREIDEIKETELHGIEVYKYNL